MAARRSGLPAGRAVATARSRYCTVMNVMVDVTEQSVAGPDTVGMSAERLALIRPRIEDEIARDRLPGGVLAIVRRGKLIHFEAYGYRDKAAGAPMHTDAIFNIAS